MRDKVHSGKGQSDPYPKNFLGPNPFPRAAMWRAAWSWHSLMGRSFPVQLCHEHPMPGCTSRSALHATPACLGSSASVALNPLLGRLCTLAQLVPPWLGCWVPALLFHKHTTTFS